jgi:tRNA pseudouridine38-40 synthase
MTEHASHSAPVAGQAPVRLRIDLAYDGSPYYGLARQPGFATVQSTLEDALERILGVEVRTVASGRTDRGVHALAQVLHGDVPASTLAALTDTSSGNGHSAGSVPSSGDEPLLTELLAAELPASIIIHSVRRVPLRFHARFSAVARAYRYRLRDGIDPRGHGRDVVRHEPHVWGLIDHLDVASMRRASRALLGEHDFATFCRRAPGRTTTRRIDVLTLRRIGAAPGRIDIRLQGKAFCHQQVRAIVGCLVEVGRGRREEDWIGTILAAEDRSLAAPVAPPHGLTLETVRFGPGIPSSPPPSAPATHPATGPSTGPATGPVTRPAVG